MSLAVILLMLGLVSGLVRGGRVSNIGRVRFRHPWLVFAGLMLQVAAELIAGTVADLRVGNRGIVVLGVSYVLLAAFVVANRRFPGAPAIAAGLLLNLAVILANGGMPVSRGAARMAGIDPGTYLKSAVKHREMRPDTPLAFLGDVIPLPFIRTVVSVGDVVLSVGIFRLVDSLVRGRARRGAGRDTSEPAPDTPEERSP